MDPRESQILISILTGTSIIVILSIAVIHLLKAYKERIIENLKNIENLKLDFDKKILETQLEIQENTFNKISKEIHDNISLGLTLSKLQLNNYLTEKKEEDDKIQLSIDLISKSLTDLNDLSKSLDANSLLSFGLLSAIESEIAILRKSEIYEIVYEVIGEPIFLKPEIELIILRVFQECCNNIIKHARANKIEIQIYFNEYDFSMKIIDNGIGFDTNKIYEKKEIRKMAGIKNIQDRLKILNGESNIISVKNIGTTLSIKIPISNI